MTLNNNEKRRPCPPDALLRPSWLRMICLPLILVACWAAVFFKAREAEGLPWVGLLLVTFFVAWVFAIEVLVSSYFARFLAPALFGFLAGAGVNVLIQVILKEFQGLNWTFQSPMLLSLGTVLLGFLGSLIFLSHGDLMRKILTSPVLSRNETDERENQKVFSILLWVVTFLVASALCVSLAIILKQFAEFETPNPLRKPLWFSVGAVLVVFLLVVLGRKNLLRLVRILLPGLIVGLVWASVVRDVWEGLYLAFPGFPLAPEVLEFLFVSNFCFLGIAWLNKAVYEGCRG